MMRRIRWAIIYAIATLLGSTRVESQMTFTTMPANPNPASVRTGPVTLAYASAYGATRECDGDGGGGLGGDPIDCWYDDYGGHVNTSAFTFTVNGGPNVGYLLHDTGASDSCTYYYDGSYYCTENGNITGTVSWPGDVAVTFYATVGIYYGTATATYTFNPNIDVTPDGRHTIVATGVWRSEAFTINNYSNTANTFAISTTCSGSAGTSCSVTSSLYVPAASSGVVYVSMLPTGTGAGTVVLHASVGAYADSGFATISTAGVVSVTTANTGSNWDRDKCFTGSGGPGVAFECGDLRVVHALPTVKTLGKDRGLTMLYNTRGAMATPTLAATVNYPAPSTTPSTVHATLYVAPIGGTMTSRQTGDWSGLEFVAGSPRRIALAYNASGDASGLYIYKMVVDAYSGGTLLSSTTSDSGEFVLVNRSASPYGAGWWPSGVEQLIHLSNGDKAWIGGDGSTRHYVHVSTNVWQAGAVDRPDSLTYDGTNWIRWAPQRTQIKFDGAGQHVATVNRFGHTTTLSYSSSVAFRLDSVNVPLLTNALYRFDFSSPGSIAVYTPGTSGSRLTTLWLSSGRVSSITDPDTKSTLFAYDGTYPALLRGMTDKRSTQTAFAYYANYSLSTLTQDAAGTPRTMGLGWVAERRGIAEGGVSAFSTLATDQFTTAYQPVGFYAAYIDQFGAPTLLAVSATDTSTTGTMTSVLDHGDARFPGLVTAVTQRNGFVTRAVYDARGRLQTSTAVNPHGDGFDAETNYTWDDTWDLPTSIVQPEGDRVDFSYDATYGFPLWQKDNRGDSTKTFFTFSTTSSTLGVLMAVQLPGQTCGWHTGCDQYSYDAMGNLSQHFDANGYYGGIVPDAIGQTIQTYQQTDPATIAHYQYTNYYPDVMGRDTLSFSASVGESTTLSVRHVFDAAGADSIVSRWATPDTTHIGTITTTFQRDHLGRVVKEIAPDGYADSTVYDTMGRVARTINRNGDTTTFAYDAMNRLIRRATQAVHYSAQYLGMSRDATTRSRVAAATGDSLMYAIYPYGMTSGYDIPSIVDTMIYNPSDLTLASANNGNAHVSRSYYPNGQLSSEVDSVGNWDHSTFAAHIYTQRAIYDRDGWRTALIYPTQIAPSGHDTVTYGYDAAGALTSLTDLQGHTIAYAQNRQSQLIRRDYRSGYYQALSYGTDGTLATDVVDNGSAQRRQTFRYDARGKVVSILDSAYTTPTLDSSYYNLLGQMTEGVARIGSTISFPLYSLDGLGNVWYTRSIEATIMTDGSISPGPVDDYRYYQSGIGRLWYSRPTAVSGSSPDTTSSVGSSGAPMIHHYDAAGNETWFGRSIVNFTSTFLAVAQNEHASYYGADGKLAAVDSRQESGHSSGDGFSRSFEEYRYDALGRRIAVRMQQACSGMYDASTTVIRADCRVSGIRRTIWDGSLELGEIQMPETALESDSHVGQSSADLTSNLSPYFGAVAYTYDGQVDQPVAVTRTLYSNLTSSGGSIASVADFTFNPVWNSHGQADQVVQAPSTTECTPSPGGTFFTTGCIVYVTQGQWLPYLRLATSSRAWQGSLMEEKRGAGGLMYRRNRYYDSGTGRFTQEDPLGLAGGMNLYGFASGDPVNFSDPMGLCPGLNGSPSPFDCPPGYFTLLGAIGGFIGGGLSGGGAGALLAVPTGELAAPVFVPAGALAGAVEGAAAGATAGAAIDGALSMANAGKNRGGNANPNKDVRNIANKNNLNEAGRRALHDLITGMDHTLDEIREIAAKVAEQAKYVNQPPPTP